MKTKIMIVLTMFVFAMGTANADDQLELISSDLQKAALAGDWKNIENLLKDVDSGTGHPVARLLKGHACLFMNHNNSSFRLFAIATAGDHTQWKTWASHLARRYPENSYAHFYLADALARQEMYDGAIAEFNRAIKLDAKNACAFHSRGIVHAQMGNFSAAGKDLARAQNIAPDVADFYNSRGMLRIAQRNGNLIRLEQQFKKATELSNDFAIAQHGLGCIELLRNPEMDINSSDLLRLARDHLPLATSIFAANEFAYEIALYEKMITFQVANAKDSKAAMGIRRKATENALINLANHYSASIKYGPVTIPGGMGAIAWPGGSPHTTAKAIKKYTTELSDSGIQSFASKHPPQALAIANALSSLRPSESEHRSFDQLKQGIRASSDKLISDIPVIKYIWPGLRAGGFDPAAIANMPQRQSPSENLKEAVRIDMFRGAVKYDAQTHGTGITTPADYKGTIRLFSPGPALDRQPRDTIPQPLAGATMDRGEVSWDTLPWPFSPLFGVFYVQSTDRNFQDSDEHISHIQKVKINEGDR